jgi:DNA-binding transcriptional LysR family regulator
MNLAGIDLNLLVAFDALYSERSVTAAARRVGLSQPAASNALARLRAVFRDPLFVRTPKGMVPTARAIEVADAVHHALETLRSVFAGGTHFDPARAVRAFTIATTDYTEMVVLPLLVKKLASTAPGISLNVRPLRTVPAQHAFQSGEVDLAIAWHLTKRPFDQAGFYTRSLFEERLVTIARTRHPVVRSRLTLKHFTTLGHVVVAPSDEYHPVVDLVLAERRLRRRVALAVPHFLVAPFIVSQTDLIGTVAGRVATHLRRALGLRLFEPPIRIPPLTTQMVWHERSHADRAHAWFRELVAGLEVPPAVTDDAVAHSAPR